MHMADALLSPVVGTVMCTVSAAANVMAVKSIKRDELCEKKIPVMGVMGAFVFAAQMINFTIPGTGSSGHIGGGIMLATMLGGFPALLSLSSVLIIQCLFFADGGLLALGSNIFNLGVIPCLIVYPLLVKPFLKQGITLRKITTASILGTMAALQLGAFGVVLETQISGVTKLPFLNFTIFMQSIHLVIGIIEGMITAAVLCFVFKMRPELMESTNERRAIKNVVSMKKLVLVFGIVVVLLGGVLSLLASSYPDGLEWALEKTMEMPEEEASSVQEAIALMPDYDFKEQGKGTGTALAGILGGIVTFLLAAITAVIIYFAKKKRKDVAYDEK